MIWLRRLLALPLIPFFMLLFLIMVFLSGFRFMVCEPGFYISQLRQADVYNFTYDHILANTLKELERNFTRVDHADIDKAKDVSVRLLRDTIPPQWFQTQVENTIMHMAPYFLGDTDNFKVSIPLQDRVLALSKNIQRELRQGHNFTRLYEQMLDWAVEEIFKGPLHRESDTIIRYNLLKSGTPQDDERVFLEQKRQMAQELQKIGRRLVPQEWILANLIQGNEQVFNYLAGATEHFTVRVPLRDRFEVVREIALELLKRPSTYEYVVGARLARIVSDELSGRLPCGLTLSGQDIGSCTEILPQRWFQEQMENLVKQAASYLEGNRNDFHVFIPLGERKEVARKVLDDFAHARLKAMWLALPEGTQEQSHELLDIMQTGKMPDRRPPGMSYEQLRESVNIDFASVIDAEILREIPEQLEITTSGINRVAFDKEASDAFANLRKYINEGLTLNDTMLRNKREFKDVEQLRNILQNGFTFTQDDLHKELHIRSMSEFHAGRAVLRTFRQWFGLGWFIIALILLAIGCLWSPTSSGKIAAAAVVLILAAGLVYVCTAVYDTFFYPSVQDYVAKEIQKEAALHRPGNELAIPMMQKTSDTLLQAGNAFVAGMRTHCFIALFLASIGLGLWVLRDKIRLQTPNEFPPT